MGRVTACAADRARVRPVEYQKSLISHHDVVREERLDVKRYIEYRISDKLFVTERSRAP